MSSGMPVEEVCVGAFTPDWLLTVSPVCFQAVEPILSVIGRKVAADNPETKALLRCKPSAKLPLGLTLSSSVVSAPGRVNSPIARPSSSVSSSPLPSTPTHHLNSPLSLSASSSPGPLPFPSLTKPPIVNLAATLCSLSHQQQLQQSSDFVRECVSDDFDRKVAAQMQGYAKDNSQVASACQQDLCGIQERLKQEKEESDQVRNERDVYQIQVSDLQIQLQVGAPVAPPCGHEQKWVTPRGCLFKLWHKNSAV